MIGIVFVSHSRKLAEGVAEMAASVAPEARMACAGGLEDGSFGTSFERIHQAVRQVYSTEGVVILVDLGSAVMTTEMVLETLADSRVRLADCPLVEGAIVAALGAVTGMSLEMVMEELKQVAGYPKFSKHFQ